MMDMEPLTLMLMAILNFIYLFLPHSFRIVLYSDHRALSVRDVSLALLWCHFQLLVGSLHF